MEPKRTKIVCTIGPASSSEEVLRALIGAGMNVARLNFSHGTHDEHAELIRRIRAVADELEEPVAILQDLQGPKIRVGVLPPEGVVLEAGARVSFTTGKADIAKRKLPVTYERLHEDVKPGERILLDDGLMSAKVLTVEGRDVSCEIVDGGTLTSHKGVNFPDSTLRASSITAKDEEDLVFGISQGVDWVALSFVRTAEEIRDLRRRIRSHQEKDPEPGTPVLVVAKIEKGEGVRNIDSILEEADGIMVARGDLGIEMPAEQVPIIQKALIAKCLGASKPVIVATQMLDSMIRNPRPTRAEVSDIANAVIDHADAVMLSGETANGKYPVEAVKIMARVIVETEATSLDDLGMPPFDGAGGTPADAIARTAGILAREVGAKAILVMSSSIQAARRVSRYRPERTIHAIVGTDRACRQLNLSWGVAPTVSRTDLGLSERIVDAIARLKADGDVSAGDRVVVLSDAAGSESVEVRSIA